MQRPFPAYQGDEPYIFVSYSHEDSDVVFSEIQWLKDQGFNIWYDEGINPGSEWRRELAESIEASSLFLYFITPSSVTSEHCEREVNYAYSQPRISPDGKRIVVAVGPIMAAEFWIYSLQRETLTRLTFDEKTKARPLWHPQGHRIIYSIIDGDAGGLYWKAADGTGTAQQLTFSESLHLATSWSEDGEGLLYHNDFVMRKADIGILSLRDEPRADLLLQTDFDVRDAALSPDGRWLAYMSNESGRSEIYVRTYPDVHGGRWQVSTSGGGQPRWGPDGTELFYLSLGGMMAVPVKTDPTFEPGNPKVLFDTAPYAYSVSRNYDIAPEGDRFLMIKVISSPGPQLVMVLNWFDELERLVPTR
jgi:serine/threonine-protein kinase|tara:strand:+ start:1061 stop:2143 length:1083 start_codon:yes stop_codon:yes gene_type:complete